MTDSRIGAVRSSIAIVVVGCAIVVGGCMHGDPPNAEQIRTDIDEMLQSSGSRVRAQSVLRVMPEDGWSDGVELSVTVEVRCSGQPGVDCIGEDAPPTGELQFQASYQRTADGRWRLLRIERASDVAPLPR
ncbi:MAG: hypothetical protein IPG63_15190 [Xanthomonadales bacterium]|nr:hypothetical protein [Xanthomonadales bacterium]MBK7146866.1 hypothetical protein [Xanthomonadales bacterium]